MEDERIMYQNFPDYSQHLKYEIVYTHQGALSRARKRIYQQLPREKCPVTVFTGIHSWVMTDSRFSTHNYHGIQALKQTTVIMKKVP